MRHPDHTTALGGVKGRGQLAQLANCLRRLFTAATLAGAALTFLVMGRPQAFSTCLRELFSDYRHW
jgi:hypothetical protein